MNLLLIGIQGSGKGTQAKMLSEKLKIPHISTGDLLRSNKEFKEEIALYINKGLLVPNELIIKLLKSRISLPDAQEGFILDGFPRTIEQAKALDKITKINKVIEIFISDEEAIKRISSRLSCQKCGAVYNTLTNPPKTPGVCALCLSPLYQRPDDNPEAIKKRLKIYHQETPLILAHYPSIKISGQQPIEKVFEDILSAIEA